MKKMNKEEFEIFKKPRRILVETIDGEELAVDGYTLKSFYNKCRTGNDFFETANKNAMVSCKQVKSFYYEMEE